MAQLTSADKILQNAINELSIKQEQLSISLKGKKYLEVGPRIQMLRKHFGTRASLNAEILENNANRVVMKASLFIDGNLVATGTAEEFRAVGPVNKTSALENCETSSWGRCLANLGLSNDKISSAEELANAIRDSELLQKSGQVHTGTVLNTETVTYDSVILRLDNASHTESLKAVVSEPLTKEFLKGLEAGDPEKFSTFVKHFRAIEIELKKGKTKK
tara:strand:- start:4415 stop:5068 length:654 start_codon:yes stop_codon:yes gene_type:complete